MTQTPLTFKGIGTGAFRIQAGGSTFGLSATELTDAGATAIFSRKGRYGGTYCHIDWTLHFTNWLDPFFYVETVEAFRTMSDKI